MWSAQDAVVNTRSAYLLQTAFGTAAFLDATDMRVATLAKLQGWGVP